MSNGSVNAEIKNDGNSQVGGDRGHRAASGRRAVEEQLQELSMQMDPMMSTWMEQLVQARQPVVNPQALP